MKLSWSLSFLSPLKTFCLFINLENLLVKRAISLGSYPMLYSPSSSSSSLELSSTTLLLLPFLLALKAMPCFLEDVMPLDRFLTLLVSSMSISWFMILLRTSSGVILLWVRSCWIKDVTVVSITEQALSILWIIIQSLHLLEPYDLILLTSLFNWLNISWGDSSSSMMNSSSCPSMIWILTFFIGLVPSWALWSVSQMSLVFSRPSTLSNLSFSNEDRRTDVASAFWWIYCSCSNPSFSSSLGKSTPIHTTFQTLGLSEIRCIFIVYLHLL
jgi:hypothetical protein